MCYMEVNRRGCLWLEVISCLSPMPACCPRPKGNKRLALLQPTHGTPEVLDPRTRKSRNVNIFSIFSYQIYSLLWFCLQCKHRGWDLVTVYPKAAQGKLPEALGFCIHVLLSSLLVTQNQAAPWAGQSCQDIEWTSGSSFHSGGPQTQGQVNLICWKSLCSSSWDPVTRFPSDNLPLKGRARKRLEREKPSYLLWMLKDEADFVCTRGQMLITQ